MPWPEFWGLLAQLGIVIGLILVACIIMTVINFFLE